MGTHEPPQRAWQQSPVRTLKIEADGDRWSGVKPKIRLVGRWLERAGFMPGNHVRVTSIAPGVIELCSLYPVEHETKHLSANEPGRPY